MAFSKKDFMARLAAAMDVLLEKSDYLSEIDARFGDGDHGLTIKKIAEYVKEEISSSDEKEPFGEFFEKLGKGIMNLNGGSAGPLWGTMFAGFGLSLGEKTELEPSDVVQMFKDALSELQNITTAEVGDKTMMDALIPAVHAVENFSPNDSVEDVLTAAAKAAEEGCKATEGFVSKFGRAKSYEEQTLGTPDVGAVSLAAFLAGLALLR